jgi:hypothetical protein
MRSALHSVACIAVLFAAATPASAQTARPERPYRGLFGGGVGDAAQLLTLSVSLGTGVGDSVLGGDGQLNEQVLSDANPSQAKYFGSTSASLAYSVTTRRYSFGASAATSGRYRPGSSDEYYGAYSGGSQFSMGLWRGSSLSTGLSVNYQPYFVLDIVPPLDGAGSPEPVITDPEFAASADDYIGYGGNVALSQQVSRRGALAFSYGYRRSEFSDGAGDVSSMMASAVYTRNLSRGLALRLGYRYWESALVNGDQAPTRAQTVDAGLAFSRALSLSRRTKLSFSTGSAAVSDGSATRYSLTGSAELTRELGRTWSTALAYDRRVQFVDALRRAILSDSAALSLSGLITRRLQSSSSASTSFAQAGSSQGSAFQTYRLGSGLSCALTRMLALNVNYSYYRYGFDQQADIPSGLRRKAGSQSLSASLSFWAPLFYRARRADAAR